MVCDCPADIFMIGVSDYVDSAIAFNHYVDQGCVYTSLRSIWMFRSITRVKKWIFLIEYGVRVFKRPILYACDLLTRFPCS